MQILEKEITWFVDRLKRRNHFCLPGYSDAEFYSMLGLRLNTTTGLGQLMTAKQGKLLTSIMQKRQSDPRWLFAIPKCLWTLPLLANKEIDTFLAKNDILIHGYERDMILDDLAAAGGLYPLIKQLQNMDTVVIGPKELEQALTFLDYKRFVPISSPNLHLEENGVEQAIDKAKGCKAVYLISAGVSAPVIIDKLYDIDPANFYIDCGSIWDAFAGIGGQRTWRAELYKDERVHKKWIDKNLHGEVYANS